MGTKQQFSRQTYFGKRTCQECGHKCDPTFSSCPNCGAKNPDKRSLSFKNFLHVSPLKEAGFIAFGLFGLSVLVFIIEVLVLLVARPSEQSAFLSSGEGLFWSYVFAYPLLFLAMGFLLWKDWKSVGASFKNWKAYIAGFIGYAAIMIFSIAYNLIVNAIFEASGIALPGDNANQSNVVAMVLYGPAACMFVIGLIGPFTEELAYRVGLFGLASRLGKWVGYLFGIIVFAFIHFDFTKIGSEAILSELISLPNYLVSGAILCFLYDKFGICGSWIGHALNNLQSVILIIVQGK